VSNFQQHGKSHPLDKLVSYALSGGLPLLFFILAFVAGVIALQFTPREEEPQIVVPVIEVQVSAPNLSARQVERQVTVPLEKLLTQISGVEHLYSSTLDGGVVVTLRFFVGQDREDALLNTYNKLYANQDKIPSVVANWQLKPIEVDDVPMLMLGLYSQVASLYNDYDLRRMAEEISTLIQGIEHTSEVKVVGGRARSIQIELDIAALSAHQTTALEVHQAIIQSNQLTRHGALHASSEAIVIESGDVVRSKHELENLLVNVINGKAVLLKDVARIVDGPETVKAYQWLATGATQQSNQQIDLNTQTMPMVTISVAKQKGSNAVAVADEVLALMDELSQSLLPKEVQYSVLRNYGQTANEKVNDLTSSLAFAVFTVVVFIGIFLGWRAAIVVGLAVPVCYGLTLLLDMLFGYSINRVTLFALILSLGLLVDDPITGIDNISRFLNLPLSKHPGNKNARIVDAMSEIRAALIMSTVSIVLAFVPLAYITGMMGPYMAPMAFNVPATVIISTFVAYLITPWLAAKLLKAKQETVTAGQPFYARLLGPLISNYRRAKLGLWLVLALFIGAALLPLFRAVPLKLLPYDNKNEVQILIDLSDSATLEQTAATTAQINAMVRQFPEVSLLAAYVGQPSPIDFNGMVRQYYQRNGANQAEIRLVLLDKTEREHQSHAVVLRLREQLAPLQQWPTVIKVIEVPPGPPVLSTFVAELYAEPFVDPQIHQQAAQTFMQRLRQEPMVQEVDSSLGDPPALARFVVDKDKAALSGISTAEVNQTLHLAVQGLPAGSYQLQDEAQPVAIEVKLPFAKGKQISDLQGMQLKGRSGIAQQSSGLGLESAPQALVSLGELGEWQHTRVSQAILHKDMRPVVYVFAELAGRTPAEVIADLSSDRVASTQLIDAEANTSVGQNNDWRNRSYLNSGAGIHWQLPEGVSIEFAGEGEWLITVDVFRDMGIAFAFALVGIFFVLRIQTSSAALALIIMSAIPLTIIGIMPGFWLMNQFGERWIAGAPDPVLFTATAMIGMIALAGIVVRNSLILVEFITLARSQGMSVKAALLAAGSTRMRPVLLTAGTTLLGNLVIILDPVFSGLALAIMFGIIASTVFSLFVVPMVYYLVFDDEQKSEQTMPSMAEQEIKS